MEYILAILLSILEAIVQTAFGFGMGAVIAPMLLMLNPLFIPGPLMLAVLIQCLLMAAKNWRDLDAHGLESAFVGLIPGTLMGVWLLSTVSEEVLSIIVGAVVLLAVFVSSTQLNIKPTPATMFIASMVSGVFASSTSVSGPPMALVMQHEDSGHIRANLAGYFVISSILSILAMIPVGHFGWEQLKLAFILMPGTLLGFYLCMKLPLHKWERFMHPAIMILCSLSGSLALAKGALNLMR
ncbi:sulfite exporter TauE/SafE family protein [Endozoicomonas sp. SCSIO W0465]|uniref:sulfite exporter TauE/SafE family protein n=1 Tax=Endozoicomonas sp. SCSIO W0465 TaxID=2918516 RepID=UPI002075AFB7|nr:sulfite exporter TauE/SafE family protein [Endozoicomonas sp. SCSIO W0465]USE36160.1 sulfite exporter TauE/SafE family protein [Endozoicomonas sp. SCSIO W0465]